MSREELDRLIEQVRQVAYCLHVYLGIGLLEKVYENGLKHRLEKAGFKVDTQKPLKVVDEDGFVLGDYYADLVVNDELIIELKTVKMIANEHLAQLLNYLAITKQAAGLLINFGSYRFESPRQTIPPISRFSRSPRPNSMSWQGGLLLMAREGLGRTAVQIGRIGSEGERGYCRADREDRK